MPQNLGSENEACTVPTHLKPGDMIQVFSSLKWLCACPGRRGGPTTSQLPVWEQEASLRSLDSLVRVSYGWGADGHGGKRVSQVAQNNHILCTTKRTDPCAVAKHEVRCNSSGLTLRPQRDSTACQQV